VINAEVEKFATREATSCIISHFGALTQEVMEGVASTDDDLYGDLDALQSDAQFQRLKQLYEGANKELVQVKAEREEMRQQIQFLQEQKRVLEINVMSVFQTAQKEVERKDKIIKSMHVEVATLKSSLGALRR
jgi:predicted  nucleic acid-binding Zn-ribbon protein